MGPADTGAGRALKQAIRNQKTYHENTKEDL
jgi:hypothetical protein